MSKDKLTDYSVIAGSNTDVGGININTGCDFGNVDNALREILSHLAETNAGTYPVSDTWSFADPSDLTKIFRLDAGSITTGTTRVITVPDQNGTMVLTTGSQDLSGKVFVDSSDVSKKLAFTLSGITTATTRTVTWPDASGTVMLAGLYPTLVSLEGLSLVSGDTLYATAADTITRLAKGTAAQVLTMNAGATAPEWQSVSTPGRAPDAVLEDQKAANTAGGTATSGSWETRVLNTEVRDPAGLVSLSSNQFTVTANGWVEWSAPGWAVNNHKTRLYNVTDSVVVAEGTSGFGQAAAFGLSVSVGGGAVVAGKTYRIENRVQTTKAFDGMGTANNFGGAEVYTRVSYWRS